MAGEKIRWQATLSLIPETGGRPQFSNYPFVDMVST
jgi:hypothetical protein